MTSNTKRSKRGKEKYPNLKQNLNTKHRRDYIETHYVNGLTDKDGNIVIRPLNEEEKAWLDQFYKETVMANRDNAQFYTEDDDWKGPDGLYRKNYEKQSCLYNKLKATGRLTKIGLGINYKEDVNYNDLNSEFDNLYWTSLYDNESELVIDNIKEERLNQKRSNKSKNNTKDKGDNT